jgi:hypothetical protein
MEGREQKEPASAAKLKPKPSLLTRTCKRGNLIGIRRQHDRLKVYLTIHQQTQDGNRSISQCAPNSKTGVLGRALLPDPLRNTVKTLRASNDFLRLVRLYPVNIFGNVNINARIF